MEWGVAVIIMNTENVMEIKVGQKKAGSYIDYIKNHPVHEMQILARGGNTSKAVYISSVIQDLGYEISDFNIENVDKGLKEPLAVLMITMRAKHDIKDKN